MQIRKRGRIWIDEAAGVQRYRSRKTDALEAPRQRRHPPHPGERRPRRDQRQREPLREQAEAARLYRQHLASLREVESGLLLQESASLAEDIERLEAEIIRKANGQRKPAQRVGFKGPEIRIRSKRRSRTGDGSRRICATSSRPIDRRRARRIARRPGGKPPAVAGTPDGAFLATGKRPTPAPEKSAPANAIESARRQVDEEISSGGLPASRGQPAPPNPRRRSTSQPCAKLRNSLASARAAELAFRRGTEAQRRRAEQRRPL